MTTTITQGNSAVITVANGDYVYLNNSASSQARIEITTGRGAGTILATNHAGRRQYGPFEAGTVTVKAIVGSLDCGTTLDIVQAVQYDPTIAVLMVGGVAVSHRASSFTPSIKWWSDPEEDTSAARTYHAVMWLPAAFNALKLRYHNQSTVASPGLKMCVAPTATKPTNVATKTVPSGGNGAFVGVTWATVSSFTATAAVANGSGVNAQVAVTDSDVMNVISLPRSDGGPGVYVMVRFICPAGNFSISNSGSNIPALDPSSIEWYFQNAVDGVTTPANMNAPFGPSNLGPCIEVISYTQAPVNEILMVGDSITQGLTATTVYGWQQMMLATFTAAGKKVAITNFGRASQTSTNYLANGLAALLRQKPRLATYFPYSPNDADKQTTAGTARQLRDMTIWIEACRTNGCMPVICSPVPTNSLNAGQEAFRRQVASAVRALIGMPGVVVLDFDALLTDYSVATGGYVTATDTNDGLHPNQQANVKMASYAASILGLFL